MEAWKGEYPYELRGAREGDGRPSTGYKNKHTR